MGDLVQLPPPAGKVDLAHRRQWIADLSVLVSPDFPVPAINAMILYLPFLEHLPDAAFTHGSLRDVAMSERRTSTPSLKELCDPLEAWWREHRPPIKPVLRVPQAPLTMPALVAPDPAVAAQVRSLVASLRGGGAILEPNMAPAADKPRGMMARPPVRSPADQIRAMWEADLKSPDPAKRERAEAELTNIRGAKS